MNINKQVTIIPPIIPNVNINSTTPGASSSKNPPMSEPTDGSVLVVSSNVKCINIFV